MSSKRKICVVTGTRAEYGLLSHILRKISDSKLLELQLVVTGTHLSKEYGNTIEQIEDDNFKIDFKVDILDKEDSSDSTVLEMSKVFEKLPDCLNTLKPDLLLVLGDRYEIFCAAATSLVKKIPVAHIHGGEVSEGAFDESFRHSITKMSHFHFTSTKEHKCRVEQLGEDPKRVFNVGAPGVEILKSLKLLSKKTLKDLLKISFKKKNYLVTLHPETLEKTMDPKSQISSLLTALKQEKDCSVVFTKSNSDPGGKIINQEIENFVSENKEWTHLYPSLGQLNYLSLMSHCDAVIGNSSSGLIEAPSLKVPAINIGSRQRGRTQSNKTINCKNEVSAISAAINKIPSIDNNLFINPYDGGKTSKKIVKILEELDLSISLKKEFVDI